MEEILEGLAATDAAALRCLFDEIEDWLCFVVEKLFLGHRVGGKRNASGMRGCRSGSVGGLGLWAGGDADRFRLDEPKQPATQATLHLAVGCVLRVIEGSN